MSEPAAQPQPQPQPAPAEAEAPAPVALGVAESFELALSALVNAPGALGRLAARPAPSFLTSLVLVVAWGAASLGINTLLGGFSPFLGAAAIALAMWVVFALLGACALLAAGKALGKSGGFDRAWQLASYALAASLLQIVCARWPGLWFLPAALGAWICAAGLEKLFAASPAASRAVCAVAAAALIAVQWGARREFDRAWAEVRKNVIPATSADAATAAAVQESMKGLEALRIAPLDETAPATASGTSSLDLLRPARDAATIERPRTLEERRREAKALMAAGDELEKSALQMMEAVEPMLSDPAMLAAVPAAQRKNLEELRELIALTRHEMKEGRKVDVRTHEKRMTEAQRRFMQLISAMTGAQPGGGASRRTGTDR